MSDSFLPYGSQWIDTADVEAVKETLLSKYLTQGPKVEEFETSLKAITGARYCVAVVNATAGLHLAIAALELPHGSEGITTPNTFVASANCLVYNGLRPVFADIDPLTYSMSAAQTEKCLTAKTKVIVPVDFAGQPVATEESHELAQKRRIFIVEDAAHAIGSRYSDGSAVGSCSHSDLTVFSFHPVKTITTGEGGAITTNDKGLYERLCLLRTHGITRKLLELPMENYPWYYEMIDLGFNFRMSDIHAALGCSQLKKLSEFTQRRREIVARYNDAFAPINWLTIPFEKRGIISCFHLYVLLVDFQKIGRDRAQVMQQLKEKGIGTQVHYIPVHTQPFYRQHFGYNWGDYPCAEEYYKHAMSIPLFPRMSDEDINKVITSILALGRV